MPPHSLQLGKEGAAWGQGESKVWRAAFQAAKGCTRLKAGKDAGAPSHTSQATLKRPRAQCRSLAWRAGTRGRMPRLRRCLVDA